MYNWFANRRKEMKRRANIGEDAHAAPPRGPRTRVANLRCCFSPPEAAILESHGIEVASPSCHSNGEEAEMQEFSDQVNQRFSEQVS